MCLLRDPYIGSRLPRLPRLRVLKNLVEPSFSETACDLVMDDRGRLIQTKKPIRASEDAVIFHLVTQICPAQARGLGLESERTLRTLLLRREALLPSGRSVVPVCRRDCHLPESPNATCRNTPTAHVAHPHRSTEARQCSDNRCTPSIGQMRGAALRAYGLVNM